MDDDAGSGRASLFESLAEYEKDYTRINPVIDEAYKLIQKASARKPMVFEQSECGFTKLDE